MAPTARRHPAVSAVKQAIDSGQLGGPALVRLHHWRPRSEDLLEKQILADLDIVLWLFGQFPISVYSRGSRWESKSDPLDLDYLQIHLGFAENGMALLDSARTLPGGAGYFSLSAIGTQGAAYADDHPNTHLVFRGGPAMAILAEPLRAAAEQMSLPTEACPALAPVWHAVIASLGIDQPIELGGGRYVI